MFTIKVDIILGQPSLKELGMLFLNMEKKMLVFPYKEKMITFQDMTMKSKTITRSSEDLKEISKLMF